MAHPTRRFPILAVVRNANLALAFGLELAVYVSVAWWGFTLDRSVGVRLCAGIGAPVALIAVWAVFGAPRAPLALHGVVRFVLEVPWFGAGALALLALGRTAPAVVFTVLYLVNAVLARVWHQQS